MEVYWGLLEVALPAAVELDEGSRRNSENAQSAELVQSSREQLAESSRRDSENAQSAELRLDAVQSTCDQLAEQSRKGAENTRRDSESSRRDSENAQSEAALPPLQIPSIAASSVGEDAGRTEHSRCEAPIIGGLPEDSRAISVA